jgi:predicted metal-binding protein
MKKELQRLAEKAVELGAEEAQIIDAEAIVFDSRSFLKCRFGCNRWGRYWTCPPNLEISPEKFQEAFSLYSKAIILKTTDAKTGQDVALKVEKEAMLSYQCMHAFAMVLCVWCEECSHPEPCRFPHLARPSMDAYGIDIGRTVEPLGMKVEYNDQGQMLPCWYSMVLLE